MLKKTYINPFWNIVTIKQSEKWLFWFRKNVFTKINKESGRKKIETQLESLNYDERIFLTKNWLVNKSQEGKYRKSYLEKDKDSLVRKLYLSLGLGGKEIKIKSLS